MCLKISKQANFITDVYVTPANVNDSQVVEAIQQRLDQRDVLPKEQYVDEGYMSGEQIDRSEQLGIQLWGRVQDRIRFKSKGFRLADFDIDTQQQRATCPAGHTNVRWSDVQGTKNVAFRAFFGKQCRTCSFFYEGACTTSSSGRRLDISRYHNTLQRRRQEQQTDHFKQRMKQRAAIEGTISEAVRAHGLRQNRYRGLAKTQLQGYMIGVAMNLKRLMAVFQPIFVLR